MENYLRSAATGVFLAAALLCATPQARAETYRPASVRQRGVFNRDWKFLLGDHPDAEAPAYDDSKWDPVELPHSFSLPYFRSAQFYVGYGWYRKHFAVPAQWLGKSLFLEFDGAFQDAEIFVNGRSVGAHQGGYTGFSIDITAAVTTGDNLVAVRLNNNWNPQLAPRAGEHEFCGGIYRDVYLLVANPLHVAWYGTQVTTPEVSVLSARVDVKTEIQNDGSSRRRFTLVSTVVDPDGQVVSRNQTDAEIDGHSTKTIDRTSDLIAHPKLWHPDHPFQYTVYTEVLENGKPVDDFQSPLGFRWFRWTPEEGFFLNGQHYYLRGANVHQDHAGWGIAVTDAGAWRDVKLIKDAGFNFIRGSHYPHSPAFSDACDRLGIILWSENPFWGKGGFGKDGYWNASAYPIKPEDFAPFEESCKRQLREMIRIHFNHPSIMIWSMTNEAFFTDNVDRAKALVRGLVALSHELDPTRPAAVGGAQRKGFDRLGDVAGYNGDGSWLYLDPGIPNMVSEYGALGKGVPGDYAPYFADLATQPEFAWRSGQAIWSGFDYGTISGKQGFKGIIDYFRLPKRAWYWYRNEYRHIPPPEWPQPGTPAKLQLTADKTAMRGADGTDDCQLIVTVLDAQGRHISNSPPVTLRVESGPGEFPTGSAITFKSDSEIMIVEGQAAIEFRSYYGGRSLIRATSPGLQDATIIVTTDGEPVFVPGKTPPVRERPYVPSGRSSFRPTTESVADVARDRPTRSSSAANDHPARAANDSDPSTSWQPEPTDHAPWWQVDLEGFYLIYSTKIRFDSAASRGYKIQVSKDGETWTTVVDQTAPQSSGSEKADNLPAGTVTRYLRVSLPDGAALSEVSLYGLIWAE
ncbi:MAG TPA: glycoside hydrolase family 2 TIM barrel-domain containing protein [Verrucomicrobiae bacterium]|nr:glycoside hydrolase family 2 TIM barrel-domain containing protein [Verrucomicrobiae bacterium]